MNDERTKTKEKCGAWKWREEQRTYRGETLSGWLASSSNATSTCPHGTGTCITYEEDKEAGFGRRKRLDLRAREREEGEWGRSARPALCFSSLLVRTRRREDGRQPLANRRPSSSALHVGHPQKFLFLSLLLMMKTLNFVGNWLASCHAQWIYVHPDY